MERGRKLGRKDEKKEGGNDWRKKGMEEVRW